MSTLRDNHFDFDAAVRPWSYEIAEGNLDGYDLVQKFGRNDAVGTDFVVVALGGSYPVPQMTNATPLRVKAGGNINDDAAGTGARTIKLYGLDNRGYEITESLTLAGITESSYTSASFSRLHRSYVTGSGTYASAMTGSHRGVITIEDAAGTSWGVIETESGTFARGQTEIGAYTIPRGYDGYFEGADIYVDSGKTTEVVFFKREKITQSAPPYESMRMIFEDRLVGEHKESFDPKHPIKIEGPADVGFLAKVGTGTAIVIVDFYLVLVPNAS